MGTATSSCVSMMMSLPVAGLSGEVVMPRLMPMAIGVKDWLLAREMPRIA